MKLLILCILIYGSFSYASKSIESIEQDSKKEYKKMKRNWSNRYSDFFRQLKMKNEREKQRQKYIYEKRMERQKITEIRENARKEYKRKNYQENHKAKLEFEASLEDSRVSKNRQRILYSQKKKKIKRLQQDLEVIPGDIEFDIKMQEGVKPEAQ